MTDIWTAVASAGPVWGFAGVIVTLSGTLLVSRRKNAIDQSSATLAAVNAASKILMDGLFEQVKVLQAEVRTLREHNAECDRKHTAAMDRIATLERTVPSAGG